jgi:lincosamide nucleotidyltransferase A/C/D/E
MPVFCLEKNMSFNIEFQHMPLGTLMTAEDTLFVYNLLENNDIRVWLDGGWAVDAHLGLQTRRHNDVDIAIDINDVAKYLKIMNEHGYKRVLRDGDKPECFVVGDDQGHAIDTHIFVWDEHGNGIYGPPENNDMWPAASLRSFGSIGGQPVRATSPECLVKFHTGYEVDADDWHDVRLLCERFDLEIPADFRRFQNVQTGLEPKKQKK